MNLLTLFGLFAVSAMLVCYAFEKRSAWFILGFSIDCALGSAYGFLQGAWPFGMSRESGRWSPCRGGGAPRVGEATGKLHVMTDDAPDDMSA